MSDVNEVHTGHGAIRVGDHVKYHPVGGGDSIQTESTGVVQEIVTEEKHVGSVNVHATPDMPRVAIRNDKTGKVTAYRPENIVGRVEEGGE
ncbi:hypothetical protein AMAG_19375 [Allomyces macrogynus ATCC 38327]|uniref:Hypervirulence associated protein TUDOR domain-containing protein n=1 Tax=Allomyces macrogynus (strain ATCC 38327) TaxID=578462 RepID=A0A0L0SV58_ALLM3|nr:hypothetical protein AMAG_19375 [Allomyces macrogynus ATCC 38327]|eukprot:KNE66275.1 hypothetical protein AMAG_19375 [Allomyces macrogynus ATCC 38327]